MRVLLILNLIFSLNFGLQGQILDTIYPSLGGEQGLMLYDYNEELGLLKFKAMDHRSLTNDEYFGAVHLTNQNIVNGLSASHLWDLAVVNDTLFCETDDEKGFWIYNYQAQSSPSFLKFVDWRFTVYELFGFDNEILAYYRDTTGERKLAILNDTLGPQSTIRTIRTNLVNQYRATGFCRGALSEKFYYGLFGNGEVIFYHLDGFSSSWDSTVNSIASTYDTSVYDWSGGPDIKWFNNHLYVQFALRDKLNGSYKNHNIFILEFDSVGAYTGNKWAFPVHSYPGFSQSINHYADFIVTDDGAVVASVFFNKWDMETWRNPKSKIMKLSQNGTLVWEHTLLADSGYSGIHLRHVFNMGDTAYGFLGWVSKGNSHWERDIKLIILDTAGNFSGPTFGQNEPLGIIELSAYPNPVKDELIVPFDKQVKTLSLVNIEGSEMVVDFVKNEIEIRVDFSAIPKGNYFLIIQDSASNFYQQKVLKQ